MRIRTTRFGTLDVAADDLLSFPSGLLGLEECRQWVLLADEADQALGWLQSTSRPELALAVVSPRRFVPEYRFRTFRGELAQLDLVGPEEAQVLVTVSRHDGELTLNLRAPIIINPSARKGRQVATNDEHPVQYAIPAAPARLKKSA
ncbi:MAG: flagellar assembly protein FliW [Planctomycetales bacterium]|jgi:flagellar assembly factor FliW|nr:flagellar assembly protein FliW [Planctomycetales bacterium]MBN8626921.1 flagellar assembly protein FliW [Planctomycetota bacterium]